MLSLWIVFALLSAFVIAIVNVVDKVIIKDEMKDTKLAAVVIGLIAFVIYSIVGLFAGISIPSLNILVLALVVGALDIFTIILYFKALKRDEVSRVVPVMATIPIFVLILAVLFLGERFLPLQYLGIFLIAFGAFLISVREKLHQVVLSKAFGIILFASFVAAISSVLAKSVLTPDNVFNILFWFGLGGGIISGIILLFHHPHIREKARAGIKHLVWISALGVLASLLLIYAIANGPVSLVMAFYEVKPLFVLLLVLLFSKAYPGFLKEKMSKRIVVQKLMAILLIVVGSLLLV